MIQEKGSLSIHSENIFPIIKKWLYSDHDIFVRELISNACDAETKLKSLHHIGETNIDDLDQLSITVRLDKKEKTIKFIDNGIGMTEDEIKRYINQIAFSGAEDFINKYKEKTDKDQIIGHFGLGFYSAFMVADQVEINTLSYMDQARPVKWICNGGTEYELFESDKTTRGTEITLFVGEDGKDFLDAYKLKNTIEKYCSFMPFLIFFEDTEEEPKENEGEDKKAFNDIHPLYTKSPSECTTDEYKEFYRKTFKDFKEPLFWIHLNMDYPFNLKGILYFPKLSNEFDTLEGQIKLYNSQVFVADNIKEVIPEYLLLLKGIIDCPDLPLNVSRSFLQNDGFVKKVSAYISKKVGDKLDELFKADRENFQSFWGDIHPFVKYGSLKDEKFYDKVKDIVIYKTTGDAYQTLDEYKSSHAGVLEKQIYYVTDEVQQAQYIKLIKEHQVEALILNHNIDQPFISLIESKNPDHKFLRVDSDIESIISDQDHIHDEEEVTKFSDLFKTILSNDKLIVKVQSFKNEDVPAMITLSEDSRRMNDMMKMYSLGTNNDLFDTNLILTLNKNNRLIKYISHHNGDDDLSKLIIEHIYDLALMSHKPLSSDEMNAFINRSNKLMSQLITE